MYRQVTIDKQMLQTAVVRINNIRHTDIADNYCRGN